MPQFPNARVTCARTRSDSAMPKSFIRLVGILLIPCLTADPVSAAGLASLSAAQAVQRTAVARPSGQNPTSLQMDEDAIIPSIVAALFSNPFNRRKNAGVA